MAYYSTEFMARVTLSLGLSSKYINCEQMNLI